MFQEIIKKFVFVLSAIVDSSSAKMDISDLNLALVFIYIWFLRGSDTLRLRSMTI